MPLRPSSSACASWCALLLLSGACGDGPPRSDGDREGRILGQALVDQIAATSRLEAPYRCARLAPPLPAPTIPDFTSSLAGPVLELQRTGSNAGGLTIAYVADARGAEAETRAAVTSLSKSIAAEGANLLISLGGLAQESADLDALFSDLLGSSDALLIAIPGDRESIPSHRQAVKSLAERGARIIDGSQYQLIRVGGILLANMPGIAMSSNLVAGVEGCEHLEIDATALLKEGLLDTDTLIVNSYAPIRSEEVRAQDRGLGAIHVGEHALVPLLDGAPPVALAIHGMVAPSPMAESGKARITKEALLLATGSLDPLERKSEALIVTLSGNKVNWQRLQVD